jgi:polyisoprenoid-binding protein YceI
LRALKRVLPFTVLLLLGSAAWAQPAGTRYRIDLEKSDIHWLVYKAGLLARLGHNHVISVGKLTGDVYVAPKLADSHFQMSIPVAGLVIDNPALRAEAGKDFEKQPTDEDIAGTRHNMLSASLLDAAKYPALKITGTGPTGAEGHQQLHLTIDIAGKSVEVTVPTKVHVDGDTLEASGKFQLTHTELGLTPFSIAGGALRVAEKMSFVYHVTADRVD